MKEGQDGRFGTLRERWRRRTQTLYEFETELHEEGYADLVHDEGQDLFRFPEDGRFAFSREWADVEQLERDKDELLNSYAKVAPETLDSLSSEERHRLYNMLRMKVTANPDRSLEVSGALGAEFGQSQMLPR